MARLPDELLERIKREISIQLTLNSRLITVTMSDSADPLSNSSRMRDPTRLRLRLNIWPC